MTAEPRPAVHALPARAESIPETLAAQWEPQHQYVGALLCQRAGTAGPLLDLVPDTAITEPRTRWTYELIRGLVADGRDPHPAAVLHRANCQPASQALRPDLPPTPRERHRLAIHLVDLYTQVLSPVAATDYARDVLDDAYRHAAHAGGQHLQHLAETCTDSAQLGAAVDTLCTDLAELAARAAACAPRQR
jgi:hypothetical protein